MTTLRYLLFALCLITLQQLALAQRVKIIQEEVNNRIHIYAVNESETDYDVKVGISGSNFRQSQAAPRFIRVPGASKVFIKTVIPFRGKTVKLGFALELNDSLSNRSLIREYETIKLHPPKPIIVYHPPICSQCDSLLAALDRGKYRFTLFYLAERPDIKEQLERVYGGQSLDSLPFPVINIGGKLFTSLDSYDQVMEHLKAP